MKKFQIILINFKTEEVKMRNVVHSNFAAAASKAYILAKTEFERTQCPWDIAAIYDMDYNFDAAKQLT
tara:strand:+ start:2032 stop:2235 length:204 start_codon:yes stop_codon:yes gene_type:complete